jgi:hypothetical protein
MQFSAVRPDQRSCEHQHHKKTSIRHHRHQVGSGEGPDLINDTAATRAACTVIITSWTPYIRVLYMRNGSTSAPNLQALETNLLIRQH